MVKIVVRDDGLATNDGVSFYRNSSGNATDSRCQMRDVGTDMSIATSHHLGQLTIVISDYQCQAIQFPRNPDRLLLSPFDEFCSLFGLGQREGSKLMFLFLTCDAVFRNLLRRRVGQGSACLLFQKAQFVEASIPFIVGHTLAKSVVIGITGLVQLADELLHSQYLVVSHNL